MKLLAALTCTILSAGLYAQSAGTTIATNPPVYIPDAGTATHPIATIPAPPTSSITYLPKWYGSVGGGGIVPGHGGTFVYESISAYLGQQTYATTAQEYTISGGKIQSCTMAGVSKPLYQFGFVTIGMTGIGGGCNSTGGGSAAIAAQGFASFHLGKGGISLVATGDKTFTTDGRQAVKLTFGVSYGK